jgi:hypothetical protein
VEGHGRGPLSSRPVDFLEGYRRQQNRRRQGGVALLQQVRRPHLGVWRKAQEVDGAAGGARRCQEGMRGEAKAVGPHDLL